MGIEFGGENKDNRRIGYPFEIDEAIDWLNKQDVTVIQKWLLELDNKRLAARILSLDDTFLSEHLHIRVMFEIFKILPFARTQLDWVKDHPHSATRLLWGFRGSLV